MWNFLIIMGIFLLIDVAYLSFWTGAYRFERMVKSDEVSLSTFHVHVHLKP